MKMFDSKRVPQPPTYQLHFELTQAELERIHVELGQFHLPGSSRWLLKKIVEEATGWQVRTPGIATSADSIRRQGCPE